jgi:restriction endonuclease S subunit
MNSSLSVPSATVFRVRRSRLRGRLDAEYNLALLTTRISSKYPQPMIRDIATSRTGGTPSKSKPEYWEGAIPWASPKDFGFFHLSQTEDHISKEAVLDSSTTVVPPGTLLIVFRSGVLQHTLPVTITTVETAINQDVKALTFDDEVSAEYAGAYFVVFGARLLPLITKSGATVQSINTEQFEQLRIPVPPKQVQRAAVETLLGAYKGEQEKEEQARQFMDNMDDVLLAELGIERRPDPPNKIENRMFRTDLQALSGSRWDPNYSRCMHRFLAEVESGTFPVHKLKEFLAMVQYGISERATAEAVGVPMLRMLNLQDGAWDLTDRKYIALAERERQSYLLQHGDILFNRTNSKELVGKCNVFDLEGPYVFASYLMRVRLKEETGLRPDYVVAYLGSSLGRIQIDAVSRQIAGMTNINAEEIRDFLIPVPPLAVQDRICERLTRIRQRADRLRAEAAAELGAAKKAIEALILTRAVA